MHTQQNSSMYTSHRSTYALCMHAYIGGTSTRTFQVADDAIQPNVHTHSYIHITSVPPAQNFVQCGGGMQGVCGSAEGGEVRCLESCLAYTLYGDIGFSFLQSSSLSFSFRKLHALAPKMCSAGAGGFAAGTDGQP